MTTFDEEVRQLIEGDSEWLDIPYKLAVLYIANMVRDPVKVKEYIHRRIPPDEAGNDFLGLSKSREDMFDIMGI